MEKRCYGCMQPKRSSPVCEHCGYDERRGNAPHQMPVGTVLRGQYVIGKALGQGGFGITYLGWDQYLNVPIAIKEYYPGSLVTRESTVSTKIFCYSTTQEQFQNSKLRFLREAQALAQFDDVPSIVRVRNFFEENNTGYIIMEYVKGTDLRSYARSRGGRLSPEETFAILRPIMEALAIVHDAGLIHRDISPDNIMLLPQGRAKLLDFGAVRDVGEADVDKEITKSTEAILKYGFAPIEQYQRRGTLGPWTDVYALCATIYYCLTGTVPPEVHERLLEGTQLEWERIPGLTPRQIAALEKGMTLMPKARTASVRELIRDLYTGSAPEPAPAGFAQAPVQSPGFGGYSQPGFYPQSGHFPQSDAYSYTAPISRQGEPYLYTAPAAQPNGGYSYTTPVNPAADRFYQQPSEPAAPPVDPDAWKKNLLMQDKAIIRCFNEPDKVPFLDLRFRRGEITEVTFLDSLDNAPKKSWDVSQNQDGSVLAWAEIDKRDVHIYIAAEGGINGKIACNSLFKGCSNLKKINFGDCFYTEETESMRSMFHYCEKLAAIDLSTLDTINVTDMAFMFSGCSALKNVDAQELDTAAVTDMRYMFFNCANLEEPDITNWDVRQVKSMAGMFTGCRRIKDLTIIGWEAPDLEDCSNFMDSGMRINGKPWQKYFA